MESERVYPPNFEVTAMTEYEDRPTGNSILRADFSGVIANPPLMVKVPLSLPASPSGI